MLRAKSLEARAPPRGLDNVERKSYLHLISGSVFPFVFSHSCVIVRNEVSQTIATFRGAPETTRPRDSEVFLGQETQRNMIRKKYIQRKYYHGPSRSVLGLFWCTMMSFEFCIFSVLVDKTESSKNKLVFFAKVMTSCR